MLTERLVKWSKEAQEFFEKAEDNSLDLTVMISRANESQTGEGFCELVNSLNSEDINRKIKKVSILDTTYLYRHYISEFAQHLDDTIPTIWFLSNQNVIKKIKSNLIIESYHKQVHSDIFKCWQEKILSDVYGDENGNGIVEDFKELLMQEAELFVSKKNASFDNCLKFLLEEYAHVCAFLKNRAIIYPIKFSPPMLNLIERYNLNIKDLHYNLSNYARKHQYNDSTIREKVKEETLSLLGTEELKVNFFVINKNGRYIYKNNTYQECVGEVPYVTDPEAWKVSLSIMNEEKSDFLKVCHKMYLNEIPFAVV